MVKLKLRKDKDMTETIQIKLDTMDDSVVKKKQEQFQKDLERIKRSLKEQV